MKTYDLRDLTVGEMEELKESLDKAHFHASKIERILLGKVKKKNSEGVFNIILNKKITSNINKVKVLLIHNDILKG